MKRQRINLVTQELRETGKQLSVPRLIRTAGGLLLLSLLVGLPALTLWEVRLLRSGTEELVQRRDSIAAQLNQLNMSLAQSGESRPVQISEQRREASEDQQQQGEGILSDRILWSELLEEVSRLIPENAWLTRLENFGMEVRLSGLARSRQDVSRFLSALSRSKLFWETKLLFVQREGGKKRQVSFALVTSPTSHAVRKGG